MKILAVDTTAKTATAALTEDQRLLGLTVLNTPNTHSVTLLPMIDGILRGAGIAVSDIELFVCSAGPGSFTGVRIGTAAIKGLAYADKKPCVGVSALEALALNVTEEDGIICPVMDARRNQLYNALFVYEDGKLRRLTPDRVITAEDLASELKDESRSIYVTGDGSDIAKCALCQNNIAELHEVMKYHNAYNVALLGYKTYTQASDSEKAELTCEKLSPVYLRASQAERERLERLEKENKS